MKLSQIFSNYYTVRKEMVKLTKELSEEQLDYSIPGHSSSIRKLLIHIAETEYWWIGCVAEGNIGKWDDSKFPEDADKENVFRMLDENFKLFSDFLESNSTDNWDNVFYSTPRSHKISQHWLVWHTVEHQARHRGQILMMMRLAGMKFKDV